MMSFESLGLHEALNRALADAGYYDAKVDGIYGPKTVAAVEALQKANGLPQTGTLDKATEKALRSELAAKGGAKTGAANLKAWRASLTKAERSRRAAAAGHRPGAGARAPPARWPP